MNNYVIVEHKSKIHIDDNGYSPALESLPLENLAQFFTPPKIADFMASLFDFNKSKFRILDPGAGTGILSNAIINRIIKEKINVSEIEVVAFELDHKLLEGLESNYNEALKKCNKAGIEFDYKIINKDFIEYGFQEKNNSFFTKESELGSFDFIITNPPYKKIQSSSATRKYLNALESESTNLYTAFLSISSLLVKDDGQLVAITPRSFCNGTYFKKFRLNLLKKFYFHRVHIYNKRNSAFNKDNVLQENIIYLIKPSKPENNLVSITTSESPDDELFKTINVNHDILILPHDENKIIHIISDEYSLKIAEQISLLKKNIRDLNINVSTGRVVDFRVKEHLADIQENEICPLFYAFHFTNGSVTWPKYSYKKKEAIFINEKTEDSLIPSGYYVFCKRFSSKEEKRRVSAAFYDNISNFKLIGIENHLNYFHSENRPLLQSIAKGLTIYLNSTLVDQYFRLFNGHTQVNADDLRYLPYPDIEELKILGNYFIDALPDQEEIDQIIDRELFNMEKDKSLSAIHIKINEAIKILKLLDFPREQTNERSALTLLALLNIKPNKKWSESNPKLIGITPIMEFIKENYKKEYAPNSRETIRRFTVHQFEQAGIVIANPDKPRPTNSPNYVYQIEENFLKLVKDFKSQKWSNSLKNYLSSVKTLSNLYAQRRELQKIPLRVNEKIGIYLSPGGQNKLVEKIIKDFCEYFTPNGELVYLGDTQKKWAYFDEKLLQKLGVEIKDQHGKMPDVIVHYTKKKWLVVLEAFTSHGPINPKRKIELERIFSSSRSGLVFITAFLDKKTMVKNLSEVAWETDVWVAEDPTHLVHLNGERFLGPYPK